MPDDRPCSMCDRLVSPGTGYVVRIEVFADPELPEITTEQLQLPGIKNAMSEVIEKIKHLTEAELQDGVHRQFNYRLCPACHRRYLANPLGMPRRVEVGRN